MFSHFDSDDFPPEPPAPSAIPVGHVDMDHSATMLTNVPIHRTDLSDATTKYTSVEIKKEQIDVIMILWHTLREIVMSDNGF